MKDSKSALKLRQLISLFFIIIILTTSINFFNIRGEMVQIAKRNVISQEDANIKEQEQVAQTEKIEEKVTTRSREERTIEKQEEIIEEEKYITIEEITISRDMDLTKRCGISKEDFIKLMENLKVDYSGFFAKNSEVIYDLCEKYEINEIFFCGLIAAESGWNIASNHRNTHNYISMMSSKGLIRYSSDEEGLEAAAKLLHNRYLTPGGSCYYGKTISSVQKRFCPNSSTWVNLVYGCMKQIVK